MSGSLASLDATACAELVHTRECTPVELVSAAIARVEAANPRLNAVVHTRFERAIDEAAAVDPATPFAGVPFLYKDIGAPVEGEPFTCGMRLLRDRHFVAPFGSHYADRIRAAGFIPLGRTNSPELGLSGTTEPVSYGATANPWDVGRTPGGSSGGSAAAVAAGLVPAAHANDAAGSIRIPAAACGLVGLKPSRGRISWGPILWEPDIGLAVEGVVTRTVRDTAALLDVLCGTFPGDPYAAPAPDRAWRTEAGPHPDRLRIGVLEDSPAGAWPTDRRCALAVAAVARTLEARGHRVGQATLGPLEEGVVSAGFADWWAAAAAGTLATVETVLGATVGAAEVEPFTWSLVEQGRGMSAAHLVTTRERIGTIARAAARAWSEQFDLVVSPTLQSPAPPLGDLMRGDTGGVLERQLRWFPLTAFANVSGIPAISVPAGGDRDGAPVGVQLMAGLGREDLLIRVAAELERALPWPAVAPHPGVGRGRGG